MKYESLKNHVELRQGLAINSKTAHLVSESQDNHFKYPLLRIADMIENKFEKYISQDVSLQCIANKDDIIYTRTGQIGLAFRGYEGVVHNNSFVVSVKTDELDADYLFVLLQSNVVREQALKQAKNSVQPDLTHEMFKSIVVPIPDKHIQSSISKIYLSISDKISINNAINAELEALAKTIYDYWFLQFEFPNEEGLPYKSSGGRMVWSEELKREIPEGWVAGTFKDFIHIGNGKDHKNLKDGTIPVYGSGGVMRHVNESIYEGESVLLPRKGTLNNVMYVDEAFWTVDTMYYSIMKKPDSALYMYYSAKLYDYEKLDSGTGVPSMTASLLYSLKIVVPTERILEKFHQIVKLFFDTIHKNEKESSELAALRDWLLPMLMNGQVGFKEGVTST